MCKRIVTLALFCALACLLVALPANAQTTWYVDGANCPDPGSGTPEDPFCRIQDGIDASSDGDTVIVRDGTYLRTGLPPLDFGGRAILLRSENGPENCIISGGGPPGIIFQTGEGHGSILQGFTIQDVGIDLVYSSPIECIDSSPTIQNNVIKENENYGVGGGIACFNSEAIIDGNTIQDNYMYGFGGGIFCGNSNASITSNTIQGNTCHEGGAGVCCDNSSPSISNNVISNNNDYWGYRGGAGILCMNSSSPEISNNTISENYCVDEGYGGGICCLSNSSPLIIFNEIHGNEAAHAPGDDSGEGGGIYCDNSSPSIVGNLIVGNVAKAYHEKSNSLIPDVCLGGGIACQGTASPTIMNNFIAYNTMGVGSYSDGYGGGIYCGVNTSPLIINNTIVDNHSSWSINLHGAGIYCDSSTAQIENCIVWGNLPDQVDGCDGLVTHSNIQGGYPGTGNIDADPLFIFGPDGCYYLSHAATWQPEDSPCVDAGNGPASEICFTGPAGTICMSDLTTRIDHVSDSGTVDMGYHHGSGLLIPCPPTINTDYTCEPASGTVPFQTTMTVSLENLSTLQTRRIAGRINVVIASGNSFSNWKSGWTNVAAGDNQITTWNQTIPDLGSVTGNNVFTLEAEDVTPLPYNQPPYQPAGDTDVSSCNVTGIEP